MYSIMTAGGASQSLLLTYQEKLAHEAQANTTPTISITYAVGALSIIGGITVAPITATIAVQYVGKCGCVKSKTFIENFSVAYAGTATAINVSSGGSAGAITANTCGKLVNVTVASSLTVTATTSGT